MAEYYNSQYTGTEIDEQIEYIKDTLKSKIYEIEQNLLGKADEEDVVKYSEKNQALGYVGLTNDGKIDNSLIEYATLNKGGIVKVDTNTTSEKGIVLENNTLKISSADKSDILNKTSQTKPIAPANLEYAVSVCTNQSIDTELTEEQLKLPPSTQSLKNITEELNMKIAEIAGIAAESWKDIQKIVRLGLASKVFSIGDQFNVSKGDSKLIWEVIGFDHDTPADSQYKYSMTLQLQETRGSSVNSAGFQFDSPEAMYYCEKILSPGIYYFTTHNNDATLTGISNYYFTLAKAVPEGGQIVKKGSYVYIYESASSDTVLEKAKLTEGTSGTFLGTTDGTTINMNHSQRMARGSNRWRYSNVRQWLNSDAAAESWWAPTNMFDRPNNHIDMAGFLYGMDQDFLSVLGKVSKCTALNTLTDGGRYEYTDDLMFLLSRSEVYGGLEGNINEGEPYPYYKDYSALSSSSGDADSNRIKYDYYYGNSNNWRLRSPRLASAGFIRYVSKTGTISNNDTLNYCGIAPACCIV